MIKRNARSVKWRVPNKNGDWTRVTVDKVPTYFLLVTLFSMNRKGYTKISGVVNEKQEWIIKYISELENELDKRSDIDEYL
jgi:hypothetical protein